MQLKKETATAFNAVRSVFVVRNGSLMEVHFWIPGSPGVELTMTPAEAREFAGSLLHKARDDQDD
jgi:hypothetical protein